MYSDETPREYITPRDDRFYTPRAVANSSSEEWQTPRNGPDMEFETPRGFSDSESKHYSVQDPHGYWNNVASGAKADFKSNSSSNGYRSNPPVTVKKNSAKAEGDFDQQQEDSIALGIMSGVSDQDVEDIFSYARHGRCEEMERLLDRGIPLNIRDQYGNTLLIIACQNGNKRVAKAVLRRGADINARNHKGNTPLHYCFHYGYGDTLGQYIISKGADANSKNNSGRFPYEGV
jgi:hypothetical protein